MSQSERWAIKPEAQGMKAGTKGFLNTRYVVLVCCITDRMKHTHEILMMEEETGRIFTVPNLKNFLVGDRPVHEGQLQLC